LWERLWDILFERHAVSPDLPLWQYIGERWSKANNIPFHPSDYAQDKNLFIRYLHDTGYSLHHLAEDISRLGYPFEADELERYLKGAGAYLPPDPLDLSTLIEIDVRCSSTISINFISLPFFPLFYLFSFLYFLSSE